MTLRYLLVAAAAVVSGAGAFAQDAATSPSTAADPAASSSTSSTDVPATVPANPLESTGAGMDGSAAAASTQVNPAGPSATAVNSTSAETSATSPAPVVSPQTVTNGPVADTPENRAKYKPLSRAGLRTAPKGD